MHAVQKDKINIKCILHSAVLKLNQVHTAVYTELDPKPLKLMDSLTLTSLCVGSIPFSIRPEQQRTLSCKNINFLDCRNGLISFQMDNKISFNLTTNLINTIYNLNNIKTISCG